MIGRAQRLVRLVPAEACTTGCARVASIQMLGKFINDPRHRGQCTPRASDLVTATLSVTDELGQPLAGATVTARFLDDYYLDEPLTAATSAKGTVLFVHRGPACVGAIAVLVDDVTQTRRVLDRATGTLTNFVIPLP
jgi:hypothetical protein